MAVEALIEPQLKSEEAVAYIDDFIKQIKSSGIAEPEKSSLIGQLDDYVRHVSIGQGGKRLAEHILYLLTPDHGGTRIGRPARA
jgi:hypothetical protein